MDWQKLHDRLLELKENFKKSHKSLSQNRTLSTDTLNKHATILVEIFNEARLLIHEARSNLDKNKWNTVAKLLVNLRGKLVQINGKYNLNISIPSILNTPLSIEVEAQGTKTESLSDSDTDIKEEDILDLTIPAIIKLQENKQVNTATMTEDSAAIRAYIKDVSSSIPEFDGQKIHLQRFITAVKLVDLAKGPYEHIAVEVIKSKIIGTTLYLVQDESTIQGIINKLKTVIVGETSQNVRAKLSTVLQRGKTVTQFTTEVDNLRKLLQASFIDEGIPAEHANTLSTREAIDTMIKRAEHESVKTVLEAGTCTTMDAAISAYIRTSTRVTGDVNKVMFYRNNNNNFNRGNNNGYRGNGRGRGNGYNNSYNRNNYNNNNRNNGNNNNRNRVQSYRGNRNNGQNRNNNGNNNNNYNNNNQNVRVAQNNPGNSQNNSGNSQQPSGTNH